MMKTNSPLFDRIRVKPDQDRRLRAELPPCEWPRCKSPATHRAPKGRDARHRILAVLSRSRSRIQQFVQFLRRHERRRGREISKGRSDRPPADLETGLDRRQTGSQAKAEGIPRYRLGGRGPVLAIWRGRRPGAGHARPAPEARKILNAQRRALETLGLEADAKRTDIKAKFKVLVKRHHPDANGGDRSFEDQLREIIQAYNYLKSAGFC